MNATFNNEVARLLAENPDLPVKVKVSGELAAGVDEWCIGDLYSCNKTEYVILEDMCAEYIYFGRDNKSMRNFVRENVWDECWYAVRATLPESYNCLDKGEEADRLTAEKLPDDELERLTDKRIAGLDWKPCILLRVGP